MTHAPAIARKATGVRAAGRVGRAGDGKGGWVLTCCPPPDGKPAGPASKSQEACRRRQPLWRIFRSSILRPTALDCLPALSESGDRWPGLHVLASYTSTVGTPAIVVIGAGLVGSAVAWELASRGAAVSVFDAREPGYGATQASAGMLAPFTEVRASGPFESLTPEKWNDAIQLTLLSTVNLCRAVLPGMKQRSWGRIINVTSIAVKQPVDGLMLSNSLRSAVTGFARTLANEVARDGITVNNILPGYTRTERVESLARAAAEREGTPVEESLRKWENEIPMRRLGEPREFAALAAFLASERASYITGTSITVDGGWTKGLL